MNTIDQLQQRIKYLEDIIQEQANKIMQLENKVAYAGWEHDYLRQEAFNAECRTDSFGWN